MFGKRKQKIEAFVGIGVPKQKLWDKGERNNDKDQRTKGKKGRKVSNQDGSAREESSHGCLARKSYISGAIYSQEIEIDQGMIHVFKCFCRIFYSIFRYAKMFVF